jgi:hypothetical protein
MTNDENESIYIQMKVTFPETTTTTDEEKVKEDDGNAITNPTENEDDDGVVVDDGTDDELDEHVDLEIDTIENTVVDHTGNGMMADSGKAYDTSADAQAEKVASMSESIAMATQEGFNYVYAHQSYILFAAASVGIFFYGDYASL